MSRIFVALHRRYYLNNYFHFCGIPNELSWTMRKYTNYNLQKSLLEDPIEKSERSAAHSKNERSNKSIQPFRRKI